MSVRWGIVRWGIVRWVIVRWVIVRAATAVSAGLTAMIGGGVAVTVTAVVTGNAGMTGPTRPRPPWSKPLLR